MARNRGARGPERCRAGTPIRAPAGSGAAQTAGIISTPAPGHRGDRGVSGASAPSEPHGEQCRRRARRRHHHDGRTGPWKYPEGVAEAKPVLSFDELAELVRHARPPTPDDVSITADGRRLDTKDKVLAFLAEIEADRAAGVTVEDLQERYGDRYHRA